MIFDGECSEKIKRCVGDQRSGLDRPSLRIERKLMLFGQFVGDWDIIQARYLQPDGTEIVHKGEIKFGWILDGRAMQDVWMMYKENLHRVIPVGTTIRFYDHNIDAWYSTWISPGQSVVQTFVARKVKDEIVLEGKTREGNPENWIFSEIEPTSFRWRSVETHDNGKTWRLTEEMKVRRSNVSRRSSARIANWIQED